MDSRSSNHKKEWTKLLYQMKTKIEDEDLMNKKYIENSIENSNDVEDETIANSFEGSN